MYNKVLLYASEVVDGKFKVYGNGCKFSWVAVGTRENIEVEVDKQNVKLKGEGPYKFI